VWSVNQDIGLARGKFNPVYHSYIWEKFLVALLWQGSISALARSIVLNGVGNE